MVYDVTDFLGMHPGGAGVILQHAGDDATYVPSPSTVNTNLNKFLTSLSEVFKPLHPPNTLEDTLDPSQILGPIDPLTVKPKAPRPLTADEKRVRAAREDLPPVDACVNLEDFERLAEGVLSGTAWAYYRSAGGSALSLGSWRLRGYADLVFWWMQLIVRRVSTVEELESGVLMAFEQHSITTKPHGNDTFSVRGCKPSLSLTSAFPPNLAAPIASAQHAT
jgi:hypothetical protein